MEEWERDELRRLATWLSRRRAVDEAVASLTAYGPAASDQVSTHLDALKLLLAAEQEAFAAVEAASPRLPQSPLPPSSFEPPYLEPYAVPSRPDAAAPARPDAPSIARPDAPSIARPDATVHSLVQARARQSR